jgi:hypothetical protein
MIIQRKEKKRKEKKRKEKKRKEIINKSSISTQEHVNQAKAALIK